MADENNNNQLAGTSGHESEGVNVGGLKASMQKFKTDKVDPLSDKVCVPTLASAPTSSTTTYTKDGRAVNFAVGQYARVADANTDTGYKFYQLYDITNGVATWNPVITGSYVWEGTTTPPNGYDVWVDPSNGNNSVLKIKNKTTGNWDGITTIKGDPSTADINLNGSIITVTNNAGQSSSIDVLSSTDERVQIVVTVDSGAPSGTTASGLTINAYYNDSVTPSATATTDINGLAVLSVPNGYKYRLVFPVQTGCKEIADVVHTASVSQRSVEVEYREYSVEEGENVRVTVEQKDGDVFSRVSGVLITVTCDGTTTNYTTDSSGTVFFIIPYGKQYTVTAPQREGWYLHENRYTVNYTANATNRSILCTYRAYASGLYVVASDGEEFLLDEWEAEVEAGTRLNSEAMLIKISTGQMAQVGGVFAIDIDMVRERTQGSNLQWCTANTQFNSIPLNGNSASAAYYLDGLTASRLVQQEGDERDLITPAVDRCLSMSRVIGEGTQNELTLPGFLGSIGQWLELWKNVSEIDEILISTRPNGTYLMSTWTTNKWSITQNAAGNAWSWASSASSYNKNYSYVVLPFFAY